MPGRGLHGLLLNVGGDLRVCGEAPRTLGIAAPWADSESTEPIALIEVKDRAVSTSGSSQRGFRINGQWYSHILDPRSGLPADRIASATVVAPRSIDADALETICNVLTPGQSLLLASSLPDVECLIITSQGQIVRSAGWHRYETARSTMPAPGAGVQPPAAAEPRTQRPRPSLPQGAATSWSRDFELVVDFEINQPEGQGRRYRRPYVAIWVENKEGFPIRNLTLWVSMGGAGPFQWLPDLKRWYRADQARKQAEKKDLFHNRPADAAPGQVQGHLGRQGRPRQTPRRRRVHHPHRRRPRARDVPEYSKARDARRAAVHRGAQGQCRDQVRRDRVSPQAPGEILKVRGVLGETSPVSAQAGHPLCQARALAAYLPVDVRPGGGALLQRHRHHAQPSRLVLGEAQSSSGPKARSIPSGCI